MSSIEGIQNKILGIVNSNIENTKIQVEQVDEDLSLLGMNSIIFIKIIVALEEAFEIEIPDEKLLITEMGTLNKMLAVVSIAVQLDKSPNIRNNQVWHIVKIIEKERSHIIEKVIRRQKYLRRSRYIQRQYGTGRTV